jgi:hypothetical protein
MFLFSLIVHSVNGKKITAQEYDVSTQSVFMLRHNKCQSVVVVPCYYVIIISSSLHHLCSIVCGLSGSAAFFIN